jgi:replicative DNA helicase
MEAGDGREGRMSITLAAATDIWDSQRHDPPPKLYDLGEPFKGIEIGPGNVCVLAGGPGAGKTALSWQWMLHALAADSDLRVFYLCVEMSIPALLDRAIAHLSQIPLKRVRRRDFTDTDEKPLAQALGHMRAIGSRLSLAEPPYTLEAAVSQANESDSQWVTFDYLQRIRMEKSQAKDPRELTDAMMNACRHFAMGGAAVLLLSSANRGQGDYKKLTLTSLKESGEIEFAADSVFAIQSPEGPGDPTRALEILKNRYGEMGEVSLRFDGATQTFRAGQGQGDNADWLAEVDAHVMAKKGKP